MLLQKVISRTSVITPARFHRGLALSIADGCELVRQTHALNTVALSGGVFQKHAAVRARRR